MISSALAALVIAGSAAKLAAPIKAALLVSILMFLCGKIAVRFDAIAARRSGLCENAKFDAALPRLEQFHCATRPDVWDHGRGLNCTKADGDSSRESSVAAQLHEQTHPTDLQDQELASLQRSIKAAWLPDDLDMAWVRRHQPGNEVGSTDIKGEGEWHTLKHGGSKRRLWRNIHIRI